ncbi:MAG: hypothetical protein WCJ18_03145, partial [Planctomycetota bacterium]
MTTTSFVRRLFPISGRQAASSSRRSSRQAATLVVERFEERRMLATLAPLAILPPTAVGSGRGTLAGIAAVQSTDVSASQTFSFGFRHVNEAGVERSLVSSVGMRKYTGWQSPAITYWGPSANNSEGRLVYRFDFAAPAESIRLKAQSPTWDFNVEPGGSGRGASAIEVSRDGQAWISVRNNLEPRNWGGDWTVDEALPAALAGATSLWVRMRFLVEGAPNSSYTVAQFGRSTSTATANVFAVEARLRTSNSAPTNITLPSTPIAENSVVGTTVGALTTTDPDVDNTFSYRLVSGAGSADNGAFEIVGNQLRSRTVFDFETRSGYSVRVRSTDQGGLFIEKSFAISVRNVNERPTGLALSASSIRQGNAVGAVIGTLATADPDRGDRHSYTLVSGPNAADNGLFRIFGSELRAGVSFSATARPNYTVRIRTTDLDGLTFDKEFTISVTPATTGLARISRVTGEGYARLVQGGIFLQQGQIYRFSVRMMGNVALDATDHLPEFWGNGQIFDGYAKTSSVKGDWTYYEALVTPPVTGTYDLKLAVWSRQSLVVTDVSLRSLAGGVELVSNGQFTDG